MEVSWFVLLFFSFIRGLPYTWQLRKAIRTQWHTSLTITVELILIPKICSEWVHVFMILLSFLSYQAEGDKKKSFLNKTSPCRDKPLKITKQDGNETTICLHHPYNYLVPFCQSHPCVCYLCAQETMKGCGVSSAWCVVHVVVHEGWVVCTCYGWLQLNCYHVASLYGPSYMEKPWGAWAVLGLYDMLGCELRMLWTCCHLAWQIWVIL